MTQPSSNFLPSKNDPLSENDVISSRALLGSLRQSGDPSLGLRNNDISAASEVNDPHFDIYHLVSSLSMSMSSIAFLAAIFKSVAITGKHCFSGFSNQIIFDFATFQKPDKTILDNQRMDRGI